MGRSGSVADKTNIGVAQADADSSDANSRVLNVLTAWRSRGHWWSGFGGGVVLVVIGALLRLAILGPDSERLTYLTFWPIIMVAALIGGVPAGATAVLLSALLSHAVFVPLRDFPDWLGLGVFLLGGGFIVGVTEAFLRSHSRTLAAIQTQTVESQLLAAIHTQTVKSHLAAIVESSDDPILSKDLDGTILSWNAAAWRLFGYNAAEIIGQPITVLIPPKLLAEEAEIIARLRKGERIDHYETTRVAKGGRVIAVAVTISPIRDQSGAIVGASKIIRDMSEWNRAEKALRLSQEQLCRAADAARLTYVQFDLENGRVKLAENFGQVLGYKPLTPPEGGVLEGARSGLLSHVAEADRAIVSARFDEIFGGICGRYRFRVIGDDGVTRWFENVTSPELDRSGKVIRVFLTLLDITSLVEGQAAAERANMAKSRFLASASHDLRQPVQSLVLLLAIMARQVKEDPGVIATTEMMKQALGGLNGLLTAILDVSRLDAGIIQATPQQVDLAALLGRLSYEYKAKAEAKGLELRFAPNRLHALVDPALLERALRNLIENALRYTPEGTVLLDIRPRGERVRIDVIDTGMGIPEDRKTDIFEEFVQVDNPGRDLGLGLGLGLSIVSRLAKVMGAEIELESDLGRGSRFSLWLPRVQAEAPVQPDEAEVRDAGGRLLVVEDNFILLQSLEDMAQAWGYQTIVAHNGEEALEKAAEAEWRIDGIVSDNRLGAGLTGVEASKEIRRRAERAIPTLILTGDTAVERINEISSCGFDLLHKPVSDQELRSKIATMIFRPN